VLIENPSATGRLNPLGVEAETSEAVRAFERQISRWAVARLPVLYKASCR